MCDTEHIPMKATPLELVQSILTRFRRNEPPANRPAIVDPTELADRTAKVRAEYERRLRYDAQRHADGKIPTARLFTNMRDGLQRLYLQEAILAAGGTGNVTAAVKLAVERRVREQLQFMVRWQNEVLAAELDGVTPSTQALVTRGMMYAESSLATAQEVNMLTAGVPRLPFYPKDGNSECLMNCYCRWQIKPMTGGYDCVWIHDPSRDNCPTCIRRAERLTASSPLRIRDGRIVNPDSVNGLMPKRGRS